MDRLMISAPDWWIEQMKRRAEGAGLSLAGLIRITCIQGWNLQPPERNEDNEGGENRDDDE